MQIGRGRAAAGQDEGFQRRKLGIEPVDLALQPGNLRIGDGQPRAAGPFFGQAEVGFDVEQVVLDAPERGIERRVAGACAAAPGRSPH